MSYSLIEAKHKWYGHYNQWILKMQVIFLIIKGYAITKKIKHSEMNK